MVTIGLADAKAHLSKLIDRVESGEDIVITRHGRPVAQLSGVIPKKKRIRSLAKFRARMPRLNPPASQRLREMRDEEW